MIRYFQSSPTVTAFDNIPKDIMPFIKTFFKTRGLRHCVPKWGKGAILHVTNCDNKLADECLAEFKNFNGPEQPCPNTATPLDTNQSIDSSFKDDRQKLELHEFEGEDMEELVKFLLAELQNVQSELIHVSSRVDAFCQYGNKIDMVYNQIGELKTDMGNISKSCLEIPDLRNEMLNMCSVLSDHSPESYSVPTTTHTNTTSELENPLNPDTPLEMATSILNTTNTNTNTNTTSESTQDPPESARVSENTGCIINNLHSIGIRDNHQRSPFPNIIKDHDTEIKTYCDLFGKSPTTFQEGMKSLKKTVKFK